MEQSGTKVMQIDKQDQTILRRIGTCTHHRSPKQRHTRLPTYTSVTKLIKEKMENLVLDEKMKYLQNLIDSLAI